MCIRDSLRVEILDQFDVDAVGTKIFGNEAYLLSLLQLFLVGSRYGSDVFPQLLRIRCMLGDSGSPPLLPRLFVVAVKMRVLRRLLGVFRVLLDILHQAEHDIVTRVVAEAAFEVGKNNFKLLSN